MSISKALLQNTSLFVILYYARAVLAVCMLLKYRTKSFRIDNAIYWRGILMASVSVHSAANAMKW